LVDKAIFGCSGLPV